MATDNILRFRPHRARLLGLSNDGLIGELCRALDEGRALYEVCSGDPRLDAISGRLDLLHEEIGRRERAGALTDDDWIDGGAS